MDINLRKFCRGLTKEDGSVVFVRWLFFRFLALIVFLAFLSFHVQMPGLIGSEGLLPVEGYLESVEQNTDNKFLDAPTLSWFNKSDGFLNFLTIGGMLFSILLFFSFAPRAMLFLLFVFYLSLIVDGQFFMSYQWDILLTETLFLSIFFAPSHILPTRKEVFPLRLPVFLMKVLLFKLIFLGGIVKLLSGDETWRNLSALNFHYYTQPIPNAVAWFMHQLPDVVQMTSVGAMLFIELIVPFGIFFRGRIRIWSGILLLLLQFVFIVTGNFAGFNYLAIALILLVFKDKELLWIRKRVPEKYLPSEMGHGKNWTRILIAVIVVVFLFLNILMIVNVLAVKLPESLNKPLSYMNNFHVVNRYGLFAVMPTVRHEIVMEGSHNDIDWEEYEFKYKPGDVLRRPPQVAPHQPRLDWQMWFAALGYQRERVWVDGLAVALIEGRKEILDLLEKNPFEGEPPEIIRGAIYEYKFTDFETRRETGAWWVRERKGNYLKITELGEGEYYKIL